MERMKDVDSKKRKEMDSAGDAGMAEKKAKLDVKPDQVRVTGRTR